MIIYLHNILYIYKIFIIYTIFIIYLYVTASFIYLKLLYAMFKSY